MNKEKEIKKGNQRSPRKITTGKGNIRTGTKEIRRSRK